MRELDNYSLVEKIHESDTWLIYKGRRIHDNHPVRVKFLNTRRAGYSTIDGFARDMADIQNIGEMDGIVRIFDVIPYTDGFVLVLEDTEGSITLKSVLRQGPTGLSIFFDMAVPLARTIGELHKRNIIHRNISPASIVLHQGLASPKLGGFGISHVFTQDDEWFPNPELVRDIFCYMSPEQTGRMNQSIDYRTDMYSLGITFYEMLTGYPPFESSDPNELIHAHMAREAVPLYEADPTIPIPVSDIVMKLLSKPVNSRYQSMHGLLYDLTRLRKGDWGVSFRAGDRDIPPQFCPPDRCIGRETEKNTLFSAIENSKKKECLNVVMVNGSTGVGKSYLVADLKKNLRTGRGYFISSRFTQEQRRKPYSAIIDAFTGLVTQILTESPENIETWKILILDALGRNGKVLTDLIPMLSHIIGEQTDIVDLTPEDSLNRIRYLFRNLMSLVARPEHPLILFLDDVHWADQASLQFIENMLRDCESMAFTFIGAYRDYEIDESHLLFKMMKRLEKLSIGFQAIHLAMLGDEDIAEYIATCLHIKPEDAAPLVPVIREKTRGEPFFINQFISLMYDHGLVSPEKSCDFLLDLDRIQSLHMTDNVIDLMVGKIKDLPRETRQVITVASLLNQPFDLKLLSLLMGQTQNQIKDDVEDAIVRGMIFEGEDGFYTMHDKFRKVAYPLIPEEERPGYHLIAGRYLLEHTRENDLDQAVFQIVGHMKDGRAAIMDQDEKDRIAELNLKAGIKAKSSGVYESAFDFFGAGISFLDDHAWESRFSLINELYINYIQAAYLTGEYDVMHRYLDIFFDHVREPLKQVRPNETRILAYMAQNRFHDAVKVALSVVKALGVAIPEPLTQDAITEKFISTGALIHKKTDKDIIQSGLMTDPYSLAVIEIMTYAIPAMHGSGHINESVFMTLEIVRLSIEKGNAPQTPFWFSCYAMTLHAIDQLDLAFRFADMAISIKEKYSFFGEVRTDYIVAGYINHWNQPLQNVISRLWNIHKPCLELGDLEYAYWLLAMYDILQWADGKELNALQNEANNHLTALKRHNMQATLYFFQIRYQAAENLLGHATSPTVLEGSMFSYKSDLPKIKEAKVHLSLFLLYFYSMYLNYLFGNYEKAAEDMNNTKAYQDVATGGMFHLVLFYFYRTLVRLALFSGLSKDEKEAMFPKIEYSLNKLKNWARHGSPNIPNKIDLIEAEIYRVQENWIMAQDHYEKAIKSAQTIGFIHEEALAYERGALFYESRGMEDFAKIYMIRACACYEKWGARAKVEHIWDNHAHLLTLGIREVVNPNQTMTFYATEKTAMMDMASVMKASQAISGEIVLSNLLKKLIHIGIENAGAQRGALVSDMDGTLYVEAVSHVDGNIDILSGMPLKIYDKLPASVINYVYTMGENILLDNAAHDERFSGDPYIIEHKVKSLMCISIRYQNKISGVFYLENNLNFGIFTPDRLEMITLLFSQAAISLENARLFKEASEAQEGLRSHRDHLEDMVQERTRELRSIQKELVESAHLAGKADVAAGVLHNVGNVLNSLCTSIHNMETILNSSMGLEGFVRANALLKENMGDIDTFITRDPKGKKLLEYYLNLGELMQDDANHLMAELNRLNEKAEVITNIIDAQQSYASAQGFAERLDVTGIINDALIMQAESMEKHHIHVTKDYQRVPEVLVEKTKLIHVLINILTNAKDSMVMQPVDQRHLTISIYTHDHSVCLSFADTGGGIRDEDLKAIFSHGFTTKHNGHGFGLHSSANYMTEMGGKMWAENNESGKGATFYLSLPMEKNGNN